MKEKIDLIETADKAGNFRLFLQAIDAADLKQTLRATGPYTVLAPVDDAFAQLPKAKLEDLFKTENKESLQSLIRNHIVSGKLLTNELKNSDQTRTMKGEELKVKSQAGVGVNEAKVISPDLVAANGVLHGIDKVLMPQAQAAGPAR